MQLGLEGKRALVTASSRGIGRATAACLLREGCRVVISARSPEGLERARAELDAGERLTAIPADLSHPEEVEGLLDATLERLGGIDILVSNTGGPEAAGVLEATVADWRAAFDSMVLPPVAMVRRLAPGMCERGWGRIVFVTSTWVKQPSPGGVLSAAARSAISALAKQLALELGETGVLVHQVMPGPTWTERSKQIVASLAAARSTNEDSVRDEVMRSLPLNRYGRPEEIADVIAFLASERASFATGTAIAVDGGLVKAVL